MKVKWLSANTAQQNSRRLRYFHTSVKRRGGKVNWIIAQWHERLQNPGSSRALDENLMPEISANCARKNGGKNTFAFQIKTHAHTHKNGRIADTSIRREKKNNTLLEAFQSGEWASDSILLLYHLHHTMLRWCVSTQSKSWWRKKRKNKRKIKKNKRKFSCIFECENSAANKKSPMTTEVAEVSGSMHQIDSGGRIE